MIQGIRDLASAFRAMDAAAEQIIPMESFGVELFAAEMAVSTPYTCEQIKAAVHDVWLEYDARHVPRGDWAGIVQEAAGTAHALQMPLGVVARQIAAILIASSPQLNERINPAISSR